MSKTKFTLINAFIVVIAVVVIAGAMNAKAEDIEYDGCTITIPIYLDADLDGFGSGDAIMACNMPDGYVDNDEDCNDDNADVYPGAEEICDGIDNNCTDGNNEGLATSTLFRDFDEDGYGDASTTIEWCAAFAGYVVNFEDCNDDNVDINPSKIDVCNGVDDNCDGEIDEDCVIPERTYYADTDGDEYGDPASSIVATSQPEDFVLDNTDCDDNNTNVNLGEIEICDGIDNNCDGNIDENVSGTWYLDSDDDGWGDSGEASTICDALTNYVAEPGDCDDSDSSIYPGAPEICDTQDNDCDGNIDEGLLNRYYEDIDDDGYGLSDYFVDACSMPDNYTDEEGDCDDTHASVHPDAHEYCDGRDNDCDGTTDENCDDDDDNEPIDNDDEDSICDCINDCFKDCVNGCNKDNDDDDSDDNDYGNCNGPFRNQGQYVGCWAQNFDKIKIKIEAYKNKGQFMKEKAHKMVDKYKGKGKHK